MISLTVVIFFSFASSGFPCPSPAPSGSGQRESGAVAEGFDCCGVGVVHALHNPASCRIMQGGSSNSFLIRSRSSPTPSLAFRAPSLIAGVRLPRRAEFRLLPECGLNLLYRPEQRFLADVSWPHAPLKPLPRGVGLMPGRRVAAPHPRHLGRGVRIPGHHGPVAGQEWAVYWPPEQPQPSTQHRWPEPSASATS